MTTEIPIACSLSADDYAERLAQVERLGRRAFVSATARPGGADITLRDEAGIRQEVDAIVAAETSCCPFLTFSTGEAGDSIVLSIDGPVEAAPVVDDLLARLRHDRATS